MRPTDVNLAQVVSQQAQLEEMVEDTNLAVNTIKQLLKRMVAPSAPLNTGSQTAVEGQRVEKQVAKATMRGNATSTHCINCQQFSRSQA